TVKPSRSRSRRQYSRSTCHQHRKCARIAVETRGLTMLALVHKQPVGLPGLIVLLGGLLLFFASIGWTWVGAKGGGGTAAKKSNLSRLGVFVQMLGFASAGFGQILIALPATSPLALGEAAAVVALMLLALGLFTAAAQAMGANWSIVARMREGHELVTAGIFAHLR